jgi:hypothetical protein
MQRTSKINGKQFASSLFRYGVNVLPIAAGSTNPSL